MAKKQSNVGMTVGLAAAAVAAAAGAFYIYGTDQGKQSKKQIKGWMLKAKGEVLEQLEKVKDIDHEKYIAAVDKVLAKYSKQAGTIGENIAEVQALGNDLKKHWKNISASVGGAKKTVKRAASKAKKAAK